MRWRDDSLDNEIMAEDSGIFSRSAIVFYFCVIHGFTQVEKTLSSVRAFTVSNNNTSSSLPLTHSFRLSIFNFIYNNIQHLFFLASDAGSGSTIAYSLFDIRRPLFTTSRPIIVNTFLIFSEVLADVS